MIHYMNLHPGPFSMIAEGKKTIELRLLDEKRKMISAGDTLVFTNSQDHSSTIQCRVVNLHIFDNFADLYRELPLDKCGYLTHELQNALPEDMDIYYPADKQRQYGVVGIEFELIL